MVEIQKFNKEQSSEFLSQTQHSPFLQTSFWASFQEKIGNKAHSLGVFQNKKLAGVAQAFKIKAKFNSYLYIPWGPVLGEGDKRGKNFEILISEIIKIAQKENCDFVRLEPRVIDDYSLKTLERLGFAKSRSFTQPECTSIIDLTRTEDELLSAMSGSTRYNVRNVERKGVKVRKGGVDDIKTFEKLLKETAGRHNFTTDIHANYYKNQYEILKSEGVMDIFVAELDGVPLAASLVTFYGDTATYLHAASSNSQPKLRAPYLLVWKTILEAKNRDFKYFDFWGIAPERAGNNHPWSGVTSFKMSFGGERVCYAPVFDYSISNKYLLAKFIELARKPAKKILRF